MKTTPLKKLQFVALIAIASFVSIQESHAYKIHCPAAGDLRTEKDAHGDVKFYGYAKIDNGPTIRMESGATVQGVAEPGSALKKLTFINSSQLGNDIFCRFEYGEDRLTLRAPLPQGANCRLVATASADYFECH